MHKKQKLFFYLKGELILHTIIVFAGNTLGGFFNLLYHLVAVRMLQPEEFGTFNALVSFIMFTIMALSPLHITLVRFFTEYITEKKFAVLKYIFSKIIKRLGIAALLLFFFFLLASSFFAQFLKTEIVYVIICGGIVSLWLFSYPFPSLIQSFQRFKTNSLIWVISALNKLILGTILMISGWRIFGGLLGFLFGALLMIIIPALFIFYNIFKKEVSCIDKEPSLPVSLIPLYKYFLPAFVAMVSFSILANIDVILVKHFFSSLEAGYYSIAQVVGKVALLFPFALAIVITPKSTEAFVRNRPSLGLLYKSLLLGGICCCFISVLTFLFPEFILKLLTGEANLVSSSLVGLFSLAMGFYSLLWITINFSLATHNLKFVLPIFLIAISEAIFIYFYHPDLISVLRILLVFSIVSFSVVFLVVRHFSNYNLKLKNE